QKDADPAKRLLFSPDGKYLALCYIHGTTGANYVELYKTDDWKLYTTLDGHTDAIEDMAFSPDGQYLATGGREGTLKVWDINKKHIYWEVPKAHLVPEVEPIDPGAVHSLAFINEEYIISGGSGLFISPSTVKLWHLPTQQLITTIFCSAFHDIATTAPALGLMGGSKALTLLDFSKYLGIKEKEPIKGVKIHPNPSKDKVTIEFTPLKEEYYKITLFDASFKEISEILEEFLEKTHQKISIPIDKLSNGVYYVQISSATASQTISFIVEK
ncbi:MAG: T9SS type A sorting domain-containing protein, partial [Chloroflexota bacterium]